MIDLDLALGVVDKVLAILPNYSQRKRAKFYKLKKEYDFEKIKNYYDRDDELIIILRGELRVFIKAFQTEISGA